MQPRDQSNLHPAEGARFLLERLSQSDDLARAAYRAAIFTPGERFDYHVDMSIEGGADTRVQDTPAPADLEKKLGTIAGLVARGAAKRRTDALPPWPHRVLRWRGPGR